VNLQLSQLTYFGGDKDDFVKTVVPFRTNSNSTGDDSVAIAGLTYSNDMGYSAGYFLSDSINGNNKEKNRDAILAVLTKDPANPTAKQKLSSFAYLGGNKDETDIKQ